MDQFGEYKGHWHRDAVKYERKRRMASFKPRMFPIG